MMTSRRRRQRTGGGCTNRECGQREVASGPIQILRTTTPCAEEDQAGSNVHASWTALDQNALLSARCRSGLEASLLTDTSAIPPLWSRVTISPFQIRHRIVHGNGRRMDPCCVSYESPNFFHIPEVMVHVPPHRSKGCLTGKKKTDKVMQGTTAESSDLPTYLQVPGCVDYYQRLDRRQAAKHHILLYKKQTLCEPKWVGPPVTPIFRVHAPREPLLRRMKKSLEN